MTTSMRPIGDRVIAPGSAAARGRGCICSQIGNFFGRGHGDGDARGAKVYEVREDCPIAGHGVSPVPADPVRCDQCGADIVVVAKRGLVCPNGCYAAEGAAPKAVVGSKGELRLCDSCGKMTQQRRGRPRRVHVCYACEP